MTSITNIWFIFLTNVFKISIMANHTLFFDLSDLLRSIPSEKPIPSYCSIFTNTHLRKFEDSI